jgi:hypothetical protein
MAKDLGPRPEWHSEESWKIESLDWDTNPADFDRLYSYVFSCVDGELRPRGMELKRIVTDVQLRDVVRVAAMSYGSRDRIIGLASHVCLWARAYVTEKLKHEGYKG